MVPFLERKTDTERCSKVEKALTPQQKADREKEVKTLIVADSQVNMLDEKKLIADVVTVPGGKTGHLANSLNWNKNSLNTITLLLLGWYQQCARKYR